MADRGCSKYTGNLATCTPFKCAQRVKGFENKNLGYHSATIRREIVGLEKDKYFATSTCNVIESDNIDGERSVICKYTDNTRNIASMRNAILFGTSAIPPNSPGDSEATKRAKFSEPTIEQKAECVKQ